MRLKSLEIVDFSNSVLVRIGNVFVLGTVVRIGKLLVFKGDEVVKYLVVGIISV